MTLAEYVANRAETWFSDGRPVAVATITLIRGSSSQPLGSRLVATDGGEFAGFVSGGCVETDVYEQAQQVLADGVPRKLHYRQVKDSLFEIGLNCDGQIDVVLERLDERALQALRPAAGSVELLRYRDSDTDGAGASPDALAIEHLRVADTEGAARGGGTGSKGEDRPEYATSLPPEVLHAISESQNSGRATSAVGSDGWNYLIEPGAAPATLLIVSASSVAFPLCKLGKALGYRVVVSDPRSTYLSEDRFPEADLLLSIWPKDLPEHIVFGPDVHVVSLNHEPRFEDDLFRTLQSQPRVGYIGAIGKRKRHTERIARQADSGFDLDKLPTIHTPVGLDLGGKSAEEVALSIMAQIQAIRNGSPGGSLSNQVQSAALQAGSEQSKAATVPSGDLK